MSVEEYQICVAEMPEEKYFNQLLVLWASGVIEGAEGASRQRIGSVQLAKE